MSTPQLNKYKETDCWFEWLGLIQICTHSNNFCFALNHTVEGSLWTILGKLEDMDTTNVSAIILHYSRARAYENALRCLRSWRSDFEAQGLDQALLMSCWQISQDLNQMQHFRQKVALATISRQDCCFVIFFFLISCGLKAGRKCLYSQHLHKSPLSTSQLPYTQKRCYFTPITFKEINISGCVCWQTPSSPASLCCAIAMCRPNKYLYKYD